MFLPGGVHENLQCLWARGITPAGCPTYEPHPYGNHDTAETLYSLTHNFQTILTTATKIATDASGGPGDIPTAHKVIGAAIAAIDFDTDGTITDSGFLVSGV